MITDEMVEIGAMAAAAAEHWSNPQVAICVYERTVRAALEAVVPLIAEQAIEACIQVLFEELRLEQMDRLRSEVPKRLFG